MSINYTKGEEKLNYLSHGAGAILGICIAIWFISSFFGQDDDWMKIGIWLYLIGMSGSYLCSTLYHAWPARTVLKEKLRRWDHAAIYWHIAGSYSPITLVALRDSGYWGWGLFVFIWICAIVGTIMSFRNLKEHNNLETTCFVLMGLTILVAFKPLLAAVSLDVVWWIIGEGICYMTGALFYSIHRVKYMHSVFHFFVLAGSVCHILAVWRMLIEIYSH